jgi:Tol biopolymer transport system component
VTRRTRTDDRYGLAVPAQPALSPDGRRIVYTLRTADRNVTALWQVAVDGGQARQLTHDPADSPPSW